MEGEEGSARRPQPVPPEPAPRLHPGSAGQKRSRPQTHTLNVLGDLIRLPTWQSYWLYWDTLAGTWKRGGAFPRLTWLLQRLLAVGGADKGET